MITNKPAEYKYLGNGSTTSFSFEFTVNQADDVKVKITDADGKVTALTSGYRVGFNDPEDLSMGGFVVYPDPSGTPLASGYTLTVYRNTDMTQEVDLSNQGRVIPDSLEKSLDKLTMISQELQVKINDASATKETIDETQQLLKDTKTALSSAQGLENTAQAWANADGEIQPGLYSAKHWAQVSLTGNANSEVIDARGTYVSLGDRLNGLQKKFTVNISGLVGDGVTDESGAFNAAIDSINTTSGYATVEIPDGNYYIPSTLHPILVPGVYFKGQSQATRIKGLGGTIFTWGKSGSGMVVGGGLKDLHFIYDTPSSDALCVQIVNASSQDYTNITLDNVRTFLRAGTSTDRGYSQRLSNINGNCYNGGSPCFDLVNGAGFYLSNSGLFVSGVLAPVAPVAMTTVSGTNLINLSNYGWDTVMLNQVIAERWYLGLLMKPLANAVIQNIWINQCVFDYNRICPIYSETSATGSAVMGVNIAQSWLVGWEGSGIMATGTGTNRHWKITDSTVLLCGNQGIFFNGTGIKDVIFNGNTVFGTNRLASNDSVVYFGAGLTYLRIIGNNIGMSISDEGISYNGAIGLYVGSGCNYVMIKENIVKGNTTNYSINTAVSSTVIWNENI